MNALEARKTAEAANTAEITELYQAIDRAAKLGDYHTHVYVLISHDIIEILRSDGYKIQDISDGKETCIRIDW